MTDSDRTPALLSVETPESVAFAYRLAGLASRGFALIVDTVVIGMFGIVESLLAYLVFSGVRSASPVAAEEAIPWIVGTLIIAFFITGWGYFVIGETLGNGRTWGKRWMGLRVVRDDGSRVRFGDSVIRNLLRIADILPGNYTIGMVSILVTKQHKRLGDMAAGTVVIRDEVGELRLDDAGEDPRVLLAREFLDRRATLATDAARWQVGVSILETFGETPEPAWDEPTLAGRIADLSGWRELRPG